MLAARRTTYVQRSVTRNAVIVWYVLKGNCLTVNTLIAFLATWILKLISVAEDAIGSYLVNILAQTLALRNVETVKCRWVANLNVLKIWEKICFFLILFAVFCYSFCSLTMSAVMQNRSEGISFVEDSSSLWCDGVLLVEKFPVFVGS